MNEQDEKMRDEFIKTGMWPNKVMYSNWCRAWQACRIQADLAHQHDREELASAKILLEAQKREIAKLLSWQLSWQGLHEQVLARNEELHEQLAAAQLAIEQKDAALKELHDEVDYQIISEFPSVHRLQEENERSQKAIAIQPSLSALNEERAKVWDEADELVDKNLYDNRQYAGELRNKAAELRNEKKGG